MIQNSSGGVGGGGWHLLPKKFKNMQIESCRCIESWCAGQSKMIDAFILMFFSKSWTQSTNGRAWCWLNPFGTLCLPFHPTLFTFYFYDMRKWFERGHPCTWTCHSQTRIYKKTALHKWLGSLSQMVKEKEDESPFISIEYVKLVTKKGDFFLKKKNWCKAFYVVAHV